MNYIPNLILRGFNQLTIILHDVKTELELKIVKINEFIYWKTSVSHFFTFKNNFSNGFHMNTLNSTNLLFPSQSIFNAY